MDIGTGRTSAARAAIYPPGGDAHTDLVYARGGGAGFDAVTIAGSISNATSGWALSYGLALDASGIAHVAYWDGANGALRHAVRGADGTWSLEDVPGGTGVGTAMETWFARRGPTTWTRARVYGAGTTYDAFAPALALDSGGAAHLATGDDDGILYHEPISATGWRTSFLYLYGNPPGNVSLALDALDQPHLAWGQTIETDSIWYAHSLLFLPVVAHDSWARVTCEARRGCRAAGRPPREAPRARALAPFASSG